MRILVAIEDETFLENLQSEIWDSGHDAEITTNVQQCSAILDRLKPDVLVIERDLLWGDCDRLRTKLQGTPELDSVPIVVLMVPPGERVEVMPHPRVVAWLEKPFRSGDSWRQIQLVLGGRLSFPPSKPHRLAPLRIRKGYQVS